MDSQAIIVHAIDLLDDGIRIITKGVIHRRLIVAQCAGFRGSACDEQRDAFDNILLTRLLVYALRKRETSA